MQFLIYILLLEATNHLTYGWILLGLVTYLIKMTIIWLNDIKDD